MVTGGRKMVVRPMSQMGIKLRPRGIRARSVLLPTTDMIRLRQHVRLVPNPDIAASFDHVVGDCEHFIWNDKAKRPGGLAVDDEIKFGWLLDRQIAGLRPT
jgi:hypothetical protein